MIRGGPRMHKKGRRGAGGKTAFIPVLTNNKRLSASLCMFLNIEFFRLF